VTGAVTGWELPDEAEGASLVGAVAGAVAVCAAPASAVTSWMVDPVAGPRAGAAVPGVAEDLVRTTGFPG
jgi:hypothetical protein